MQTKCKHLIIGESSSYFVPCQPNFTLFIPQDLFVVSLYLYLVLKIARRITDQYPLSFLERTLNVGLPIGPLKYSVLMRVFKAEFLIYLHRSCTGVKRALVITTRPTGLLTPLVPATEASIMEFPNGAYDSISITLVRRLLPSSI